MVELEDDGIPLAAVDAGVRVEVLEEVRGAFEPQLLFLDLRLVDVPLAVRRVVLFAVRRAAGAAEGVALALGLTPPREALD